MKFALSVVPAFIIAILLSVMSINAMARGSVAFTIIPAQSDQRSQQQLRVNSSKQAAQMAQSRFGGKVLKVQAQKSGYRVKLIKNDGNIISVYVDAKSGQVSGGY